MRKNLTYLDYNATAPVHDDVRESMIAALSVTGNPSSVHAAGREARQMLEKSRSTIAEFMNVRPSQVIFTSGGTEANYLALSQVPEDARLISGVEHPSIIALAPQSQHVAVDQYGMLNLDDLKSKLATGQFRLLAVMAANNETGVIQPIKECAELAKQYSVIFHVDAVQSLCKMDIDFAVLHCDTMALSAHKIGGPKGVGALIIRDGLAIAPLIGGGGQELRRRGGTENLPGIAGFAAAVETMSGMSGWQTHISELRAVMERQIHKIASDAVVFGENADRLCNTSCIAMPNVKAETQTMAFDLAGIAISAGSACSSGKVAASHVLKAMGAGDELAGCAIRVSLGWGTTRADVDHFCAVWKDLYLRTRNADFVPFKKGA